MGNAAPCGPGADLGRAHQRVRCARPGDFEDAYQNAATVSTPGTFPPYTATALWVCLELVEAAMRTGRTEEAAMHVAAMREANLAAISPG